MASALGHLPNLLVEAAERLGVEDLGVYDAAMVETQFSKAVAMLKDAIPEKLLILKGENPLTMLYKPLSQQLHGMTDEECLQQAADIRLVLTVLLENIAEVMKHPHQNSNLPVKHPHIQVARRTSKRLQIVRATSLWITR